MNIKRAILTSIVSACLLAGCAGNRQVMFDIRQMHHAQRYDDAINAYEKNRTDLEAEQDPKFKYAQWRRNLCESYMELHRFSEFFACAKEAEHGAELHPELLASYTDDYALLHNAMAEVYLMLGMYDKALEESNKSQYLFSKYPVSQANVNVYAAREVDSEVFMVFRLFAEYRALEAHGKALALLGRHKDARKTIEQMNAMIQKNNWMADEIQAKTRRNVLNKLSSVYIAMDDFAGARDTLLRYKGKGTAEAIWDTVGSVLSFGAGVMPMLIGLPPHPEAFSDFVTNATYEDVAFEFKLSKVAYETGDMKTAKAGYDKLLSYNGAGIWGDLNQFGNIYYVVLHDRGRIAKSEGDNKAALKYFTDAISVIESQRSTIQTEAAKIGFVGDKQAVYDDMVDLLVTIGQYDQAFNYAERGKARALVDLLASRSQEQQKSAAALHVAAVSDIDQAEARVLSFSTDNNDKQRSADRALIKTRLDTLKNQQPELASLVTVDAPQLRELQQRLANDETLIEYYGNEDHLFAFVLTRKGIGAVKLNGKGLAPAIARYRATLTNPATAAYRSEGRALYARLIEPLEKQVATDKITIVPHGVLHYLPFAALFNGQYFLIDHHALRILPSASVLQFVNKKRQAQNSLLVLGNPDLKDRKLDLPGAEAEAVAITKIQPGSQLLLRQQATETAIKNMGSKYRNLHFASHGVFDPDKPLDSGLLLASDNQNDGTLTVGELYGLNLNADLVTLSACETALGKIANGDDVVGFTRGFLYAGANSIVSSLWKVDDRATSELMQGFYQTMKVKDKRESLRLAQLHVKQKQPHPYYWAAFQITGAVN